MNSNQECLIVILWDEWTLRTWQNFRGKSGNLGEGRKGQASYDVTLQPSNEWKVLYVLTINKFVHLSNHLLPPIFI